MTTKTDLSVKDIPQVPQRFQILKELGRGGMAVVYQAYDSLGGREVALKFVGQCDDSDAIKRFRREAMDLAAVFHPNIVDFYSVGESNGQEFIEMEYVGGGTLKSFAETCHSLGQMLRVFSQICEGLEHIHQRGMVHRDIKPINILMTTEGRPKISDLGLARRSTGRSDITELGMVMGTAGYLAPEQVMSHFVGPAADLYALGICLFEAVTGQHPFPVEGTLALIRAHLEQKAPLASSVLPGLPSRLDSLLAAMLEKDPLSRPSSATQVKTELESCLAELEQHQDALTAASPPAVLERARRHLDERRPEEAMTLLKRLADAKLDPYVRAEVLFQQARALEQQRSPDTPRIAWEAARACRSLGSPSLGSALLVLGRSALRVRAYREAFDALQEARETIPSSATEQQIELMETLAQLHDTGGLPGLTPEEGARFREIAAGLRLRRKTLGATQAYQVVFAETVRPPSPRLGPIGLAVSLCLALGLIAVAPTGKSLTAPAGGADRLAAEADKTVAQQVDADWGAFRAPSATPSRPNDSRVVNPAPRSEAPALGSWRPGDEPIVVRIPVKVIPVITQEAEATAPIAPAKVVKTARFELPKPDYVLAAPRVEPKPDDVLAAPRVEPKPSYSEPDSTVHRKVRARVLRSRASDRLLSDGFSGSLDSN